jgi:hypothetical protein
MLNRMSQSSSTAACNDNGALPFALRRAGPPKTVLTIAGRVCETVLLSYVAKGCMIVSAQGRRAALIAA